MGALEKAETLWMKPPPPLTIATAARFVRAFRKYSDMLSVRVAENQSIFIEYRKTGGGVLIECTKENRVMMKAEVGETHHDHYYDNVHLMRHLPTELMEKYLDMLVEIDD